MKPEQFNKLKEGMKIKNYKQLCELIEEETKSGKSKKAQLKEIERHIKLEKQGHAFTIKEVYASPQPKQNHKIIYNDYIQKLILDLLAQNLQESNDGGVMYLTTKTFLETICLINDNYSFCRNYLAETTEFLDVEHSSIYEFYLSSYSSLKKALESGLKQLRSKALVMWDTVLIVDTTEPFTEQKEHRVATQYEKKQILKAEKQVLKEMGYTNTNSVLLTNQWQKYVREVTKLLQEHTDINYYYKAYEVVFTNEVLVEQEELAFLLAEEERRLNKNELNQKVIDRLHNKAVNKINKAQKEAKVRFGKPPASRLEKLKIAEDFMKDINKITEALIKINTPSIKGKVDYIRQKNEKEKKEQKKKQK
jgi:hypothetical protein